jgi:hypothetical protein
MNRWLTGGLVIIITVITLSCERHGAENTFDELSRLEGRWESVSGPLFIETWHTVNDSVMRGTGLSLFDTDTVFKENLKIYVENGSVIYAARPGDAADYTLFTYKYGHQDNFYRFLNPEHDYPNIIAYLFVNDTILEVVTSNLRGNKSKKFILRKSG